MVNFECSICFEQYNQTDRKPIVLKCGHGLCKTCAHHIRKSKYLQSTFTYSCPHCKESSEFYIVNYDIMSNLSSNMDPVQSSLEETIELLTTNISTMSLKYTSLNTRNTKIQAEIRNFEQINQKKFTEQFKKVEQEARVRYDHIVQKAKIKSDKMIADAVRQSEHLLKEQTTEIKKQIELENHRLEKATKKFDDHMRMEQMVRQHKRNFIQEYDKMMKTLTEFKTIMNYVDIIFKAGNSAKKDIKKIIATIQNWPVESFISKLNE